MTTAAEEHSCLPGSVVQSSSMILQSEAAALGVVLTLGENDVLLGRGTGPNENRGNIGFREIIKELLKEAKEDNTVSEKKFRFKLARNIVDIVKAKNGCFLRQLTKAEVNALQRHRTPSSSTTATRVSQDLYAVVPDKIAIVKTRQAFRFQLEKHIGQSKEAITNKGEPRSFQFLQNPIDPCSAVSLRDTRTNISATNLGFLNHRRVYDAAIDRPITVLGSPRSTTTQPFFPADSSSDALRLGLGLSSSSPPSWTMMQPNRQLNPLYFHAMRGPESSMYHPSCAATTALAQQRRKALEDDLAVLLLERQKRQEAN